MADREIEELKRDMRKLAAENERLRWELEEALKQIAWLERGHELRGK